MKAGGQRVINTTDDFEACYVHPKAGPALVVGSKIYATRVDRRPRYRKAIGVDMISGPGVDAVINLEEPLPAGFGPFAHIDCVSVLEHSKRPWLLAANLERLLQPEGTIYVQVPFVWRVHAYPSDYWRFTVEGVKELFANINWAMVQFVYGCKSNSIPNMHYNEILYFARTQVCAFGTRV